MSGYFITGTGTEVGKTIVSALLIKYLLQKDPNIFYYKPVETGVPASAPYGPDVQFVLQHNPSLQTKETELSQKYSFELPASPHLSSRLENKIVSLSAIIEQFETLKKKYSPIICEGAGGILVPINDNQLTVELVKQLNIPAVIVAPPGLGMINHTLMTIEILRNHNIPIKGVIINRFPDSPSVIEHDNIKTIEKQGRTTILAIVPESKDIASLDVNKLFNNWE